MRTANAITGADGHLSVFLNGDSYRLRCGETGHHETGRNLNTIYHFEEMCRVKKNKGAWERVAQSYTMQHAVEACPLGVEALISAGFDQNEKIKIFKVYSPFHKGQSKMIGKFFAAYRGDKEYGVFLKNGKHSFFIDRIEVRTFLRKGF